MPFKNFTSENHLPSNETYQIHEDKEGFIWICTDRGAVRFDGQNFKHFSSLDGLVSNTVFSAVSDAKGRTWFFTLQNELCYHFKHKIYKHPLSDTLKKRFGKHSTLPYLIIDSSGGIFIAPQSADNLTYNRYYYISPSEETLETKYINTASLIVDTLTHKQLFLLKENKKKLLIGQQHHIGHIVGLINDKPKFTYQRKGDFIYAGEKGGHELLRLSNGKLLFFSTKRLILFDPQTEKILTSLFPDSSGTSIIIKIHEDKDKNLWLSTTKGILFYKDGNLSHPPKVLFKDYFITSILIASNGSLWFSTYKNGVFWIPNRTIQFFLKPTSQLVNSTPFIRLFRRAKKNYGITRKGTIYQLSALPPSIITKTFSDYISDVIVLENDQLLCSDGIILKGSNWGLRTIDSVLYKKLSIKSIFNDVEQEQLWLAAATGLYKQKKEQLTETSIKLRTNVISSYSSGLLLVGTHDGLFSYNPKVDTFCFLGRIHQALKERITSIEQIATHKYIVGTLGSGLLLINDRLIVERQFTTRDGLVSLFIKNISIENDSVAWVGSNNGCNRIQFNTDFSIKKIHLLASNSILPSSSVNDVLVNSNKVWIATDNGLAYIDNLSQWFAPEETIPKAYLLSAKANGQLFTAEKQLDYSQDHLEFEFASIYFGNQKFDYSYRLLGVDKNWYFTNENTVHYVNLEPGKYQFQIGLKLKDGTISPHISSFSFLIKPHYTQTLGFKILVLLFILLLIGLWLRMKLKQNRLEMLKVQAEQKALHSQIKPHFIFNAMNSILYFIEKNNKKSATLYLSSFSRLLRRILENSQQDLVLLSKELEALKEYLKLEQLRMEEQNTKYQHNFEIRPIPSNAFSYKMPPMLLQSLVENAIIHGLATKKGDRHINISINAISENLEILITDNGIGRAASKKINAKRIRHQPTGIKNTQLRLDTLSLIYKKTFTLEVVDLEIGTKIILTIPKLL